MIVDALQQTNANSILRELPEDQIERMRTQANQIGAANLSRAADIAAEGLTQMRGATAPRLILELICGRILLPGADTTERGLLSRIERLERAESISVPTTPAVTSTPPAKAAEPKPVKVEEAVLTDQDDFKKALPKSSDPIKTAEPEKAASLENKSIDVTGLRRIWPDVIEEVKKKRRLTWSLLSASAQIVSMDENSITIGIVNPGARDSFLRSESDVILRQAFIDVVGVDKKIEVIVDSSIDTNTPAARAVRVDESPTDKNQLSGPELLARELGAKIVKDDR
jgi:DNA polymerase-3 subunit gamma/tau